MADNKLPTKTAAKAALAIAEMINDGIDLEDAAATVSTMLVDTLVTQHGWARREAQSAALSLVVVAVQALDAIFD